MGDRSRVHLVLASPLVSRSHALLVENGDGLYIRDLCSSNGILINDQKVHETTLHDGDQLRIGPFGFHCRIPKPVPSEAQEPVLAEVQRDNAAPVSLNGRRTTLIGSRRGCEVRVDDIGVSPVHAVIFCRRGRWFIRDLCSEGGTRIFGRLIREAELLGGEQIRIGAAAIWYIRPDQESPGSQADADANIDVDEQHLTASLLDGVQTIEIGPEESAFDGLPAIGENWARGNGFDAPQVTADDLGLDVVIPQSALASASNLRSADPEQTLMDASRSILTLEDLIDMPTTAEELGLTELPAEGDAQAEGQSAWQTLDNEDATAGVDAVSPEPERGSERRVSQRGLGRAGRSLPLDPVSAFEHELIGNAEESGSLPQPWALLGIDSALAGMGLSGDVASTSRHPQPAADPEQAAIPAPLAAVASPNPPTDDSANLSLQQITFAPLVAGWAKCPGCGIAFPLTASGT